MSEGGRLRVLVLARYGRAGASSRLRFVQYFPALAAQGIDCVLDPLIDDATLARRYALGRYAPGALLHAYLRRWRAFRDARSYDLVLVEKEALPWLPARLELALLAVAPFAMDFDDAAFHGYDRHPRWWVRRLLGRRLDILMAAARVVVAGNAYLAARAREAGARDVVTISTVVDLDRYPLTAGPAGDGIDRIVWIGSPSSAHYLDALAPALRQLAARRRFRLRVIGARVDLPDIDVEHVEWSEASEAGDIAACCVGVMPLADTAWARGKCGYKLIQYMACGLPVVASPVGANTEIVEDGVDGLLAADAAAWDAALARLLDAPGLRARMGQAGRAKVARAYSVQAQVGTLAQALRRAGTT